MVDSAYFVKSTSLRSFTGYFQHCADIVTDIWKMCMKKFDAEIFFFFCQTYRVFNLAIFG